MNPAGIRRFARSVVVNTICCAYLGGCSPDSAQPPSASAPPAAVSPIAVGENVLVSGQNPAWEHTEYMGDADPANPDKLMVCTMLFSPRHDQLTSGIYVSDDGGRSWDFTHNDTSSRLRGVWDPACAFGLNGAAYFMTLRIDDALAIEPDRGGYGAWANEDAEGMALYRSEEGARTWGPATELGFIDNEDITIDRTGGPFHGRIYVYGNVEPWTDMWLIYSDDGGENFKQSARRVLKETQAVHGGPGTVLPDGTLLLSYKLIKDPKLKFDDPGYFTMAVASSTDGGRSIGAPVAVAPHTQCANRNGATTPFMASDHSDGPFRGRAYIVWGEEYRNHCTLYLAYSDDKGASWSQPVRVSDERPRKLPEKGPDIFLPTVAVNNNGVVGATWYDRREDPNNADHRLRFSASLDGGETWLSSVPVSAHSFVYSDPPAYPVTAVALQGGGRRASKVKTDVFDIRVIPGARLYEGRNNGMGDYAAIAVDAAGRFHTFWIDNRSGVAQLYTAPVTVTGRAVRDGSVQLADLANVTASLEFQSLSSVWDAGARTVTVEYQLLNTSGNG